MSNYVSKQRKYKLALFSMTLMLAGLGLASVSQVLAELFTTFCSSIIALNLVFGGSNVGAKWVLGKALTANLIPKAGRKEDNAEEE
jgi:hypothetical protein